MSRRRCALSRHLGLRCSLRFLVALRSARNDTSALNFGFRNFLPLENQPYGLGAWGSGGREQGS